MYPIEERIAKQRMEELQQEAKQHRLAQQLLSIDKRNEISTFQIIIKVLSLFEFRLTINFGK
ncbi:hypothetical protein J2S74_000860 [Evansella vedderi]|uniref:Uncharacterized protein n=1 Tax=Evansella vedderi TaxID=38282 RepID=A0ABT9ZQH6_9BACI|nr:hypothetical protein [Evansella vedderi]MDQ0253488.1 hypothetical protein [Evansella vedderi]